MRAAGPWGATILVSFALLIGFTFPTAADHPQDVEGGTVTFDHIKGNEWWVEVDVDFEGTPDAVYARDTGDAKWHALTLRDWGYWAGSFHIEPGHEVKFRAEQAGATAESCWFTHPDGVERCGTSDGFAPTFDTPGGNEWWVEVYVDADQPIAGVDARADDGAWHTLEKKDWGAWAASFHVPDGSLVTFRAHSTSGETASSDAYRWPSGEPAGDGGSEEFDATFDTPGGNEWWVEVYVDATGPLAGVDARADDGPWHALDKKDWGAWAASFHVPDGSLVTFRAHSTDGDTALSDAYRWPSGEPAGDEEDPDPTTLDAAFGPKASGEWWVETYAIAEENLTAVEARIDGGKWKTLDQKDWGAWAASFHVPQGSIVEFRATGESGGTDVSPRFHWPDATPVDSDASSWPREGAYAHYDLGWGVAGETHGDVDAYFVHHDGTWRVLCEGDGYGGDPYFKYDSFAPPFGPTDVAVGDEVRVETIGGCNPGSFDLTVEEQHTHETRQNGDPVTIDTWFGEWVPECRCDYNEADWETDTGLTVYFGDGMTSWSFGGLEDTNAPIDG